MNDRTRYLPIAGAEDSGGGRHRIGADQAHVRLPLPGQYVRRAMPFRHPISENDIALGVVCAQRQDLMVRGRLMPRMDSLAVGELDDDQVRITAVDRRCPLRRVPLKVRCHGRRLTSNYLSILEAQLSPITEFNSCYARHRNGSCDPEVDGTAS